MAHIQNGVNIARKGQLATLMYGINREGLKSTVYRFLKFQQLKYGEFMGEDDFGNKYYENLEYPMGQHRWVEYKLWYHDASQVQPGWHAWLHHVCDDTPFTAKPGGYHVDVNVAKGDPYHIEQNIRGSNAPYAHNMGHVQKQNIVMQNTTQAKSRGYEVGSGWGFIDDGKEAHKKNEQYMQPGHPLHPDYQPSVNKTLAWNPATAAKSKAGLKQKVAFLPDQTINDSHTSLGYHEPTSHPKNWTEDKDEKKQADH